MRMIRVCSLLAGSAFCLFFAFGIKHSNIGTGYLLLLAAYLPGTVGMALLLLPAYRRGSGPEGRM